MENNMMSLSISKEMLTPVIEQQVKAMMTTILSCQEQIVDTIIKRILETKVDRDGRPTSYSDGKTYFEWLLKDKITKAVKMAREEEREKACKAYCVASGCEDANECHATYCAEIIKFKELLNK